MSSHITHFGHAWLPVLGSLPSLVVVLVEQVDQTRQTTYPPTYTPLPNLIYNLLTPDSVPPTHYSHTSDWLNIFPHNLQDSRGSRIPLLCNFRVLDFGHRILPSFNQRPISARIALFSTIYAWCLMYVTYHHSLTLCIPFQSPNLPRDER
jgi:hypothetical protein